jgi:hypothetical protein
MLEDELHLATMKVVVEVGCYGELRAILLESFEGEAQVGHDPEDLL